MRKTMVVFATLAVLLAGAVAYAGWGGGPGGGGPMMRGGFSAEDQKLLDETADLRKDMHLKMFEFREAMRKGEYQKAEALEKEIEAISGKLEAKLGPDAEKLGPGSKRAGRGGYGRGYGRGYAGGGYGSCDGPCGQGPCQQ